MSEFDLPSGWTATTLGSVLISVIGGGTPSRKVPAYFDGPIPWFTVKDMRALKPNDAEEHISEAAIADSATNLIPANTLIVATRIALGRAMRPTVSCAINQDLKALVLGRGINPDFLLYWIGANQQAIQDLGSGTTVSGIRLETLHGLPLLLPPAAEQTRIVEKLEELLSDLDAGVAELKAAQKKLAQYRQSLLKAAVEGALTAEWRAKHPSTKTGAQLLERILSERRARWEAKQLAKFKEQGKTPPKDWQKKYPEPVQPDTTDLPELPDGWVWTSLDMLGEIASGIAKGTKRDAGIEVREVPYLRVANVQRGFLDLSEVKTILATERDIAELTLQHGDILFNEGGDRDKLGRGWVWRNEVANCIHQNHVFRMRPYSPEVLSELISHHGNTFGKTWFQNAGKQTTNLASINMTMLRTFPVPLAPAEEQVEILLQLQLQLDSLDRQEQSVELGITQSIAQRKNILSIAFSGHLVRQDPNDEPASALLDRIRTERTEREKAPRHPRKKEGAPLMKKSTADILREWIKTRTNELFTFEEISEAIPSDYDVLKDAVIALLSQSNPIIEQVFEKKEKRIAFRRTGL